MADEKIERSGSNTLTAFGTYIKGKIPKVDSAITESSNNAASSAAVFAYVADKSAAFRSKWWIVCPRRVTRNISICCRKPKLKHRTAMTNTYGTIRHGKR